VNKSVANSHTVLRQAADTVVKRIPCYDPKILGLAVFHLLDSIRIKKERKKRREREFPIANFHGCSTCQDLTGLGNEAT
jgi:hypothetical protein